MRFWGILLGGGEEGGEEGKDSGCCRLLYWYMLKLKKRGNSCVTFRVDVVCSLRCIIIGGCATSDWKRDFFS